MTKRTFRFDHPFGRQRRHSRTLNLLPLKTVLLAAEKDVPSRVPHRDSNEQLAFELIEKMKAAHKTSNLFERFEVESPRPILRKAVREMAGSHA